MRWEYDSETGLYCRFQDGGEHKTENSGQVSTDNVVLMMSNYLPEPDRRPHARRPDAGLEPGGDLHRWHRARRLWLRWTTDPYRSSTTSPTSTRSGSSRAHVSSSRASKARQLELTRDGVGRPDRNQLVGRRDVRAAGGTEHAVMVRCAAAIPHDGGVRRPWGIERRFDDPIAISTRLDAVVSPAPRATPLTMAALDRAHAVEKPLADAARARWRHGPRSGAITLCRHVRQPVPAIAERPPTSTRPASAESDSAFALGSTPAGPPPAGSTHGGRRHLGFVAACPTRTWQRQCVLTATIR